MSIFQNILMENMLEKQNGFLELLKTHIYMNIQVVGIEMT